MKQFEFITMNEKSFQFPQKGKDYVINHNYCLLQAKKGKIWQVFKCGFHIINCYANINTYLKDGLQMKV